MHIYVHTISWFNFKKITITTKSKFNRTCNRAQWKARRGRETNGRRCAGSNTRLFYWRAQPTASLNTCRELKFVGCICVWTMRDVESARARDGLHCWPSGFNPAIAGRGAAAFTLQLCESSWSVRVIVARTIAERSAKTMVTATLGIGCSRNNMLGQYQMYYTAKFYWKISNISIRNLTRFISWIMCRSKEKSIACKCITVHTVENINK